MSERDLMQVAEMISALGLIENEETSTGVLMAVPFRVLGCPKRSGRERQASIFR